LEYFYTRNNCTGDVQYIYLYTGRHCEFSYNERLYIQAFCDRSVGKIFGLFYDENDCTGEVFKKIEINQTLCDGNRRMIKGCDKVYH